VFSSARHQAALLDQHRGSPTWQSLESEVLRAQAAQAAQAAHIAPFRKDVKTCEDMGRHVKTTNISRILEEKTRFVFWTSFIPQE
jgi:hypothetical protein